MNCQMLKRDLSALLDGELEREREQTIRIHLLGCRSCQLLKQELELIRLAVGLPEAMPASAQQRLWRKLRQHRSQTPWSRCLDLWSGVGSFWRDLNRKALYAKLLAVPVTLLCFGALAMQFPVDGLQPWTLALLTPGRRSGEEGSPPTVVQLLQRDREVQGLMRAAWITPYEDSLSLVARIQPGGYAEIGQVLEFPRNPLFLEAVDEALRNSRFEVEADQPGSLVFYSFQKVDVYEGQGF